MSERKLSVALMRRNRRPGPAVQLAPLAVLLLALTSSEASPQAANERQGHAPGPEVAFREAVRVLCEQFHLSELTADSLQKLISDPAIREAHAAALVAIVHYTQDVKDHGTVSCASLVNGQVANEQRLASVFHEHLLAIQHASRKVFATGKPDFSRLQQGPLGDCYFFSVTGWMALNRQEVVRATIQAGAGSTYDVRMPGGPPTVVPTPTDTELCFTAAETITDGIWVPILLKAWGEHVLSSSHNNRSRPAGADPVVATSHGGSSGDAIRWWTGHEIHMYPLPHTPLAEFRQALEHATANHLVATLGTNSSPPINLPKDHIQALLGFDSERNMLRIWNPWGTNFTPHGEPGPQNGYARQHGIWEIPLADAHRGFSHLVVEIPASGAQPN